jgi:hypothetical protein
MTDGVILTGTVGAGKTTALHALGALLAARSVPHALVDADAVRLLHPAPAGDPFQQEVELRNLRDLSRNYREAGARVVLVAAVIERAADLPRYAEALGSRAPLLVRLVADPAAVLPARRSWPGSSTRPVSVASSSTPRPAPPPTSRRSSPSTPAGEPAP